MLFTYMLWISCISHCLLPASEDDMHECKTHESQVLGWNNVCTEVHAEDKVAFLYWAAYGKPRQGPICIYEEIRG